MPDERPVLIVTEPRDVHADFVVNELKKRDVPVFRFHVEDFPVNAQISISGSGTVWSAEIRTPLRSVCVADVRSAWLRRPGDPVVDPALRQESLEFAIKQARSTLTALFALVGDRWLSSPDSMRIAADKVRQMRLAAAAGLAVPDTVIGNDVDRVLEFHNGNERMGRGTAVKSLWVRSQIRYDGGLRLPMTTKWPRNVESDQVNLIRVTPTVFQEYVPKQREIRAVVIGDRVFAASVDSQSVPAARHDVRAVVRQARYEPYDLPDDVAAALLEVVRGFGLRFCSADLVLTPDGRHVFLDLNANGQWLWLEVEAGLPLSAAMADLLAAGLMED